MAAMKIDLQCQNPKKKSGKDDENYNYATY